MQTKLRSVRLIAITIIFTSAIFATPTSAATSTMAFSSNSISKRYPCINSSIIYKTKVVKKSNKKPIKGAKVTFKVYYSSKTTSYSAGKTNSSGVVSKSFKIGRAKANYKVVIKAKATKDGKSAVTTTWFKPKKCN